MWHEEYLNICVTIKPPGCVCWCTETKYINIKIQLYKNTKCTKRVSTGYNGMSFGDIYITLLYIYK